MSIDFIALFLIGFLGGFSHCIGMCGGFVATYTFKMAENEHKRKTDLILVEVYSQCKITKLR